MLRNWALALRPSLSLDFLAGLNDSRITYSGGANGTRIDSSGVIVAATTPRFDYDPVTLAARGLLVEEARTNLLTYSSEFDNAIWLKNSAAVAVTANATTSPDGTTNADKIYEADTSTTDREVYQTIRTITASATCTGSIYVKQAERTTCQVRITSNNGTYSTFVANINLATGAITGSGTAGGMVSGSASIQPAANGFYRVIITGVFAADVTQAGVDVYCYNGTTTNYAGAVNSGFFVWGAQFEAGSFATSYIPTTTASVTRTADSAVMTGTNFSSWFNPVQGTFVVAGDRNTAGGSTGVMFGCAETGVFNNSLYASNSSGGGSVIDIFYPTPGDPLWADVAVVFNFQGPNGSTAATDGKGHAFTYIDGAVISTAVYSEGALFVNNGTARVQADTNSADFELPGDFCIEIEAYASAGNTGYQVLLDTAGNGSGSGGYNFENSSARGIAFVQGGAGRAVYAFNPNDSIKHRYCYDRSGTTLRLFVDGVLVLTDTYAAAIGSNGFSIGAFLAGVFGAGWLGHIAAIRVTRASRYTATHTPPALPFPEANVAEANVGRSPANILNPFKLATSYAANDFSGTVDGQSPATDASGTVPTPMQVLAIGSAPWAPTSAQWNGHIRSIVFYPSARPGSLQALSS